MIQVYVKVFNPVADDNDSSQWNTESVEPSFDEAAEHSKENSALVYAAAIETDTDEHLKHVYYLNGCTINENLMMQIVKFACQCIYNNRN